MLLLLSLAAASAEDCPALVPASVFDQKLKEVEKAIRAREPAQLQQRMALVHTLLPCLLQPLRPEQASFYHLLHGLELWIQRNPTMGQLYFSSAKATGSHGGLLSELYPQGHQVLEEYRNALPLVESSPLDPAPSGRFWFDGQVDQQRPLYRPTIFQHESEGRIVTALLEPGAPMPSYVHSPVAVRIGWADLDSSPSGAYLQLDSGDVFTAPLKGVELTAGRHELRSADPCYQPATYAWQTVPEEGETILLALKPVPASLELSAVDGMGVAVRAKVTVDGRDLGHTPVTALVPVCSSSVVVYWQGKTWRRSLELDALGTTSLSARFSGPDVSSRSITSPLPSAASKTSKATPADSDKDGIYDTVDDCPYKREDFDGVRDSDGCPEDNEAQVRPVDTGKAWEPSAPAASKRPGLQVQIDAGTGPLVFRFSDTDSWRWGADPVPPEALPVLVRASFGYVEPGNWKPVRGLLSHTSFSATAVGGQPEDEVGPLGFISRENTLGFGLYTPARLRVQLSARAMAGIATYRFSSKAGSLPVGHVGATGTLWPAKWLGVHGDASWRFALEENPHFSTPPLLLSGGLTIRIGASGEKKK
jgi:hypothetical protein